MSPSEAREIIDLYSAWPVVVLDPVLILAASRLHETATIADELGTTNTAVSRGSREG